MYALSRFPVELALRRRGNRQVRGKERRKCVLNNKAEVTNIICQHSAFVVAETEDSLPSYLSANAEIMVIPLIGRHILSCLCNTCRSQRARDGCWLDMCIFRYIFHYFVCIFRSLQLPSQTE